MDSNQGSYGIPKQATYSPLTSSTVDYQKTMDLKNSWNDRNYEQVLSKLTSLQSGFSSLLQVISTRLKYDRTKEEAFEVLYQEMEELKQDQEISQLRPLYIDLIMLIDRMNSIYNNKMESGCKSPELVDALQTLSHEVLEILYRRGVELIVSTSTKFDPKIQQVMEVISTVNPEEDNMVEEVLRHGFKYKDVILRPEEVIIKKLQTM